MFADRLCLPRLAQASPPFPPHSSFDIAGSVSIFRFQVCVRRKRIVSRLAHLHSQTSLCHRVCAHGDHPHVALVNVGAISLDTLWCYIVCLFYVSRRARQYFDDLRHRPSKIRPVQSVCAYLCNRDFATALVGTQLFSLFVVLARSGFNCDRHCLDTS